MGYKIAIDGPSGAGKSSLAKAAANKLNFIYVDTGAIYRAIGLYMYRNGIDVSDADKVGACLPDIDIKIKFISGTQHVFLNGEDVSEEIRMHIISDYASKVGAIEYVREFLLNMQREFADKHDVIMDGRDIGTVVLPHADLKIYLTASAQNRAERRLKDLIEKGENVDFETVLNDVKKRDERDINRKISPLKIADDAVILDTTGNNLEQSLEILLATIKEHMK